jgi:hypothetical protein
VISVATAVQLFMLAVLPSQTPASLAAASPAQAGSPADRQIVARFEAALLGDVVPQQDASELRPRLAVDTTWKPNTMVRAHVEAMVEALAADRSGFTTTAIARARDAWVEVAGAHADLRAGFGRVIWGRLDEIQPSDVINPLDASRFLLDSRSEARLAVTFVRGRIMPSDRLTFEGVFVPVFRRAVFDELDERSSPFNLTHDAVLPAAVPTTPGVKQIEPQVSWQNVSGGGRVLTTIGRVDLGASVYRGFDGFGPVTFEVTPVIGVAGDIQPAVVGQLVERHPRFTMVAGDFETTAGPWAIRGETAVFVERTFAAVSQGGLVAGRAIDGGVGVDRRLGASHVFGSVLVHHHWSQRDARLAQTDVDVVASIDRRFVRDHYLARAFAVVNPGDRSAFVRGIVAWNVSDHISLEASAGTFLGSGTDTVSRFDGRDFVFGRVRIR